MNTTMSTDALLRLFQLSSSLCPVGAFAYSQGLESAVERGFLREERDLAAWLQGVGEHGLAALDLPLLLRAHDAFVRGEDALGQVFAERVLANREAHELREQEQKLGWALGAVLENLGVLRASLFRSPKPASYVVAFALGSAHYGVGPEAAALGYVFAWAEQQVSAAARLGVVGHMATQRVLSHVLAGAPEWVKSARALEDGEVGSSTPALAMAAAWHETQYTRLFRS